MPAPRPHQHTYTPPPAPTNTHTPLPPPPPTHIHPSPRTPGRRRWVVMHACSHLQRQQRGVATSHFILFSTSTRSQPDARVCRAVGATSLRHGAAGRQPMTWDVWCQTADDVRCSLVMCLVSDSRWLGVSTRYVSAVWCQDSWWREVFTRVWCQTADDVRCSLVVSGVRQPMTWGVHSLCVCCLVSDSLSCEVFTRYVCSLVMCSLSGVRQPMTWGVHSLCVHCLVSDSRWRARYVSAGWCHTADDVRCSLVICPLSVWCQTADDVRCLVSDSRWREVFTRQVSGVVRHSAAFRAKRSSATPSCNVGTACAESREQSRSWACFTAVERDPGPRSETEVGVRVYSVCVWYTGHGALLKSLTCVCTSLDTELADPNLTQVLRSAVASKAVDRTSLCQQASSPVHMPGCVLETALAVLLYGSVGKAWTGTDDWLGSKV